MVDSSSINGRYKKKPLACACAEIDVKMDLRSSVTDQALCNAMTIDVEDYFQVSAFEHIVNRDDWNKFDCRVEASTDKILAMFSAHKVKATFFVLGWIAERYPELVKRIHAQGHEIASHGYDHQRVSSLNAKAFRSDVVRTKSLLEDLTGAVVKGYRAPSYSIGRDNLWAIDVLHDTGHKYSSSIYPVKHDHYGMPEAPRFSYHHKPSGLLEIPITTVSLFGRNIPGGGGGYFRFFPYRFSKWAIDQVNTQDRQAAIFYLHPWELDPAQPRQGGLPLKTRFRHYVNLSLVERRLERLLNDFEWNRMDRIFLPGTQY